MARIVAFIPDLLFGSNVLGAMRLAGHDAQLVSALEPASADCDVLVVDLTADPEQRIAEVARLGGSRPPVLGFYSHVENEVRERAQEAGFDLVVPRSRMAREGPALITRLLPAADE